MSYKSLIIWQLASDLSVDIHKMSVEQLPKFELYEVGSQIRRSSKSIRSNIVEGYGRRRYKQDFIRFLIYAHASIDETVDHLETLKETGSLKDEMVFNSINERLLILGRKLYNFLITVEKDHNTNYPSDSYPVS